MSVRPPCSPKESELIACNIVHRPYDQLGRLRWLRLRSSPRGGLYSSSERGRCGLPSGVMRYQYVRPLSDSEPSLHG